MPLLSSLSFGYQENFSGKRRKNNERSLVNKLTTVPKQLDNLYIKSKTGGFGFLSSERRRRKRERKGQSENQGLYFPPNYP